MKNKVHPGRKIHMPNGVWTYKIGRSTINIRDPDGFRTNVSYGAVSGWSENDIERGRWKRYFKIIPSEIKTYIENNLLHK